MTNKLFSNLEAAEDFLKEQFGDGESFDVGIKHLFVKDLPVLCAYISGLVDGEALTQLLSSMLPDEDYEIDVEDEKEYFESYFNFHGRSEETERKAYLLAILSGQVTFITKSGYCYVAELRNYPGRSPEEPDNEKVIRGSRDGFTEGISQNTALIRRRIRNSNLRFELHKISKIGQTDVAIAYMKDVANEDMLEKLRQRLDQINHDGLTMADKSLEEWLFKQKFHPVPFVRYTERPDIAAAHLLEGHIAIMVDTSPSVILVPITIFHLLQHAEEYRQAPLVGTFVRFMRYFGAIMGLLLLPLWYVFATNESLLPDALSFLGTQEKSHVPLLLQILIADIGIEFLRMAAIHTPTPLSTAMGLVAGVIIGQIAIDVGLFSAEVVLYTAVAAILIFIIPSYELSISIKIFRLFLLLMVGIWGVNGLFIGIFLVFTYLCSLRPMQAPYFWPLVPFFPMAMLRVLIRFPMTADALRPYVVASKQRKRS
ncbi:spore germination protein [Lysinibacillus fusiformis]|jgi:stage V sporulation protein AF|uniref:Stage V sporulation protein AF n=1 Tax=Lysinibacillus fusiformis TaxID=28031 RepID=A0A1H9CMC8_9BACI|nr:MULTISPECIES: spore germination protein [Lysinibacillus]AJK88827.1 stage V sporulation protein AF [Lysinibacillus fusiformis]KAB0441689.1 spore germination protein [Lysinibacillus fusiformis]KEK09795.1 stage V sporulation protein AF [Lysinibacillus sphaericus]KGA82966.1 stage V sporulation protein AF [Lysinibacillus fusiformis]KHK52736.1 stage V sporulation protein AF [Lysinibacillus sp. A1]